MENADKAAKAIWDWAVPQFTLKHLVILMVLLVGTGAAITKENTLRDTVVSIVETLSSKAETSEIEVLDLRLRRWIDRFEIELQKHDLNAHNTQDNLHGLDKGLVSVQGEINVLKAILAERARND